MLEPQATDDGGVDRVLMPTWTDKNGQDDLILCGELFMITD